MELKMSKDDHEAPLITGNSCRSQCTNVDKEDQPRRSRLQRWRYGWKVTVSLASAACVFVLAFNLGFLSWAAARHRVHGGQGVLYEGNCDHVRHLSTGIHLLINILGTILLGASNYCMQCLCAPTRRDIDKAHAKGNWLDVGVPSFRNLLYVSRSRSFMWIVLVVSSFPLHLVYNSTIFSTTAAYSYTIFAGPNPMGKSAPPNITANGFPDEVQANLTQFYNDARNGSDEYELMDGSECINAYATTYQTKYGDVLLIPPTDNGTNQYAVVGGQSVFNPTLYIPAPQLKGDPSQWLCPPAPNDSCSSYVPRLQSQADQGTWVVQVDSGNYRVDSCLVRKVPELCKLQYSLALTISVIVANVIKCVIMLYMAITSAEPPMLTTGDAVASFLHQPDNITRRKCLVTQKQFQIKSHYPLHGKSIDDWYEPLAYSAKPKRWSSAVSSPRWAIISLIWAASACGFSALLIIGVESDGGAAWDAEFGVISAKALIRDGGWTTSVISNTILANIPQLIFSALYFCFNSILTSMASAAEWSRFGLSRRGLRVSWNPQGSQRSSYFLSLPYRYAIPLMSCSALLHWLISQSFFLVGIDAYKVGYGRTPENDVMTCGYTPRAIISGISIGIFMFICLIAVSCKKLASGMPVAGSCTFAIGAACHPNYNPNNQDESKSSDPLEGIEFMRLQWGAVPVDGPVGHCAFSEKSVEIPQEWNLYQ